MGVGRNIELGMKSELFIDIENILKSRREYFL